jgi:hypothetical protein
MSATVNGLGSRMPNNPQRPVPPAIAVKTAADVSGPSRGGGGAVLLLVLLAILTSALASAFGVAYVRSHFAELQQAFAPQTQSDQDAAADEDEPPSIYDEWFAGDPSAGYPDVDEVSDTSEGADPPLKQVESHRPDIRSAALDMFIAEQYPGFNVERRGSFPGFADAGRLTIAYLLRNKRRPEFRLMVAVAQLKKSESDDGWDSKYYIDQVGRVLTDDEVFSRDAIRQQGELGSGAQDAIVDAALAKAPANGIVWSRASVHSVTISASGERGSSAIGLLLANNAVDTYTLNVDVPEIPGQSKPVASITTNDDP